MTSDVRVGVIGVGYLGFFHAEKYSRIPGVQLVGVADVRGERAIEVANALGVKPYTDYLELLNDVQAVSVVVPTTEHYTVARACLERGIDVLLEKPMTSTLAEADQLIDLAGRNNAVLQVGHLERYNPAVIAMEQYLTRPMFIESHRLSVFKARGVDVDVVLDLMIHDIDIVFSIVRAPLASIHAVGVPVATPSTDIANARLIFENGCTANVTVSRISRENLRRVRIFQPNTYISVDYGKKKIVVVGLTQKMDADGLPQPEITSLSFDDNDALAAEILDFVENVRQRRTPKVSGREGRQALAVALEIVSQINAHVAKYRHLLK